MANMSYCRFENTYRDLAECVQALNQGAASDLSTKELTYAKMMIQLCEDYANNYGDEILDEAEDRKNMEDVE